MIKIDTETFIKRVERRRETIYTYEMVDDPIEAVRQIFEEIKFEEENNLLKD